MRVPSPSAAASILVSLGAIDKFLRHDLTTTLSDGRKVLEPQKDWGIVVENCATLRSFKYLLTDDQNKVVERLVDDLQSNLNAIADFLRHVTSDLQRQPRTPEAEALLLQRANVLIEQARTSFAADAEALRVALEEFDQPLLSVPAAISESLQRFALDNHRLHGTAFLMMRFGTTTAHEKIANTIRTTLSKYDLRALRADDKQYHDDLFANIQTYMHGCGFGIAVYERIEQDDFNPNVSLEVGYMSGLGKPVLLLKDRTLRVLPTDLIGRLYKVFDALDPAASIPVAVEKWLQDRAIID
jgi:hypothetical protein